MESVYGMSGIICLKRRGREATLGCGGMFRSATLGPEFLSLDPRLSVQPHVEVWDSHRPTNLLRSIHELPSLIVPFAIRMRMEKRL